MFWQRAISGIILVIILGGSLILGDKVLWSLVCAISIIAFFEMMKATNALEKGKRMNKLAVVGTAGILGYYLVLYFAETETYLMFVITLTVLAILVVYVFTYPKHHAKEIMATVFAFFYAPIMLSHIYMTRSLSNGIYIVWLIFISSWICDTFAYLVGMLIGKHKMAPRLSPKKSIEGGIGGIAGAALVGLLYGYILVSKSIIADVNIGVFALIAGIGAAISQVGDLAASAIKRNYEIKDYGKLIPGHGGILDRFDSVIFTAPMIYYLAVLLLKM